MDDWSDEKIAICADILQILNRHNQPILIENLLLYHPSKSLQELEDIVNDMVESEVPIDYGRRNNSTIVLTKSAEEVQEIYEELRNKIYK